MHIVLSPFSKSLPWVLGGALCIMVLGRYLALSSSVMDMGVFLAGISSSVDEPARLAYGHLHPLMFLWGVGYLALPADLAPLVLVGLQALVLLGSVVAVWRVFGTWPGVAMLLYYPLWANALFDFHYDHLAVPVLVAFFIACERQRFGLAAFAAAALVLVKEPFALQTVACGLYLGWLSFHFRGQGVSQRLLVIGSLLALFGGVWFFAATHWLIPYFSEGNRGGLDSDAFSWLGTSLSGMIWTLISQPDRAVVEILGTPGKLLYLAVVFGLLVFVPLLRPAALIVALPLLAIAMLSRLDNYYSYATHYTAGAIVPAIVAFRDGLPVAKRWFYQLFGHREKVFGLLLLAWLVGGHMIFASSPISRLFWSDKVWSYSWRAYVPTERETMIKAAILAYIPADREISVTTQNSVNWGHLAHRKVYLPFPMGVGEPHKVMDWSNRDLTGVWKFIRTGDLPPVITHARYADYVVLDLWRPYFVRDRGCEWIYGECRDKAMKKLFLDWVAFAQSRYDTVFEQDGLMILRRRADAITTHYPEHPLIVNR